MEKRLKAFACRWVRVCECQRVRIQFPKGNQRFASLSRFLFHSSCHIPLKPNTIDRTTNVDASVVHSFQFRRFSLSVDSTMMTCFSDSMAIEFFFIAVHLTTFNHVRCNFSSSFSVLSLFLYVHSSVTLDFSLLFYATNRLTETEKVESAFCVEQKNAVLWQNDIASSGYAWIFKHKNRHLDHKNVIWTVYSVEQNSVEGKSESNVSMNDGFFIVATRIFLFLCTSRMAKMCLWHI